jgi:hypothetical protein
MARVTVAIDTAKESIGKGLIDGLIIATGSLSIDDLQTKIVNLGTTFATIFVAVGNLIYDNWNLIKQLGIAMIATFTAVKVYTGVVALLGFIDKLKDAYIQLRKVGFAAAVAQSFALNPIAGVAAAAALVATIIAGNIALDKFNDSISKNNKNPFKVPDFTGLTGVDYGDAKRLEDLKIKAAKAQEKAAKAALKDKSKIFDLETIQIYAALQSKLSEDDRTRVQLQLALLDENVKAVDYLSSKLAASQGQTSALSTFLRTLPDAKNPFEKWGDYLKALELEAKRIGALSFSAPGGILDYTLASLGIGNFTPGQKVEAKAGMTDAELELLAGFNAANEAEKKITEINVFLDGDIVGNAVTNSQINNSLSGSFNQLNRSGGKGAVAIL